MAQKGAKRGGLFSWFSKPKTVEDLIGNVFVSVSVDEQAKPMVQLIGDPSTITALDSALEESGVRVPMGHTNRSIIFEGEKSIDKLVGVLEKIHKSPRKLSMPELKNRATEEAMQGLDGNDLVALRKQASPELQTMRSHLKLAIRDKKEALAVATPPPVKTSEPLPDTEYTLDAGNSPRGGVALAFPANATQKQRHSDLQELRAEFGDKGKEVVTGYQLRNNPKESGIIINGITAGELLEPGQTTISRSALVEKIRARSQKTEQDMIIDLAEVPNLPDNTKSVSLNFPEGLPRERKQQYLQELRAAYGDDSKEYVRGYQSKTDPGKSGVTIVGITKDELLQGQPNISSKALLKRLRDIATAVEVEPIPVPEPEKVAQPSASETLTEFFKAMRSKMIHDQHIQGQHDDKATIAFPKLMKTMRITGIPESVGDLKRIIAAFKKEGFPHAALIAGNEIHVDLGSNERPSHADAVRGNAASPSLADKMEQVLGTAFKPGEVSQLMDAYNRRNPPAQAAESGRG